MSPPRVCTLVRFIVFLFLPVIQKQLNLFKDGWASHALRTEGNRTPLQLWILSLFSSRITKPRKSGVQEVSFVIFKLCLTYRVMIKV